MPGKKEKQPLSVTHPELAKEADGWNPRESDPYVNADSERGYNMAGYFPQATRNYLLGITLGF